jgi:cytochrome P450
MELNAADEGPVRWDPYDPKFFADPYPIFRRLRAEAPVYRNDDYGFYAVSLYEDASVRAKLSRARLKAGWVRSPYATARLRGTG